MARIETAFFDLSYLDTLAAGDSPVHRLDPRIKVLLAAVFVVSVVSFHKYALSAMLPYVLLLVLIMGLGRVPLGFVVRKIALVSPFALMIGIFNPFFDQQVVVRLGDMAITGGWISFGSILLRFTLTVGAMLVLIATTGFNTVCQALVRLGMPKVFAVQLLLLYRYIFVLIHEGRRLFIARSLRAGRAGAMRIKTFGFLVGQLLLRTLDRAQRIHLAMLCRGFDGTIRVRGMMQVGLVDLVILLFCASLFVLPRLFDLPLLLGRLYLQIMS